MRFLETVEDGMEAVCGTGETGEQTAVCGPVRTVVWEGRRGDSPPYPDLRACATGPSENLHTMV